MRINDFEADDQDTLGEKTKEKEGAVTVKPSNAVGIDGQNVEFNGKPLNEDHIALNLFLEYKEHENFCLLCTEKNPF